MTSIFIIVFCGMNGLDKSTGKSPETKLPDTQIAANGRELLDSLLYFFPAFNPSQIIMQDTALLKGLSMSPSTGKDMGTLQPPFCSWDAHVLLRVNRVSLRLETCREDPWKGFSTISWW